MAVLNMDGVFKLTSHRIPVYLILYVDPETFKASVLGIAIMNSNKIANITKFISFIYLILIF